MLSTPWHALHLATSIRIVLTVLLLASFTARRRSIWPWADHVVFWGTNVAVAAFTAAILLEADDWFRVITPVLGVSLLVGIATFTARLWSSSEQAVPQEVPATV